MWACVHLSEANPRIPSFQSGHTSPHVCVGHGTHMCTGPPHWWLSASLLAHWYMLNISKRTHHRHHHIHMAVVLLLSYLRVMHGIWAEALVVHISMRNAQSIVHFLPLASISTRLSQCSVTTRCRTQHPIRGPQPQSSTHKWWHQVTVSTQ